MFTPVYHAYQRLRSGSNGTCFGPLLLPQCCGCFQIARSSGYRVVHSRTLWYEGRALPRRKLSYNRHVSMPKWKPHQPCSSIHRPTSRRSRSADIPDNSVDDYQLAFLRLVPGGDTRGASADIPRHSSQVPCVPIAGGQPDSQVATASFAGSRYLDKRARCSPW